MALNTANQALTSYEPFVNLRWPGHRSPETTLFSFILDPIITVKQALFCHLELNPSLETWDKTMNVSWTTHPLSTGNRWPLWEFVCICDLCTSVIADCTSLCSLLFFCFFLHSQCQKYTALFSLPDFMQYLQLLSGETINTQRLFRAVLILPLLRLNCDC